DGSELAVLTSSWLVVSSDRLLAVTGSRPLAFAVYGDASIAGAIVASAAQTQAGAGADHPALCADAQGAGGVGATTWEGGGGGGGGYGTAGASGGASDAGAAGGSAGGAVAEADLSPLHGGCSGGAGGGPADERGDGGGGG